MDIGRAGPSCRRMTGKGLQWKIRSRCLVSQWNPYRTQRRYSRAEGFSCSITFIIRIATPTHH